MITQKNKWNAECENVKEIKKEKIHPVKKRRKGREMWDDQETGCCKDGGSLT